MNVECDRATCVACSHTACHVGRHIPVQSLSTRHCSCANVIDIAQRAASLTEAPQKSSCVTSYHKVSTAMGHGCHCGTLATGTDSTKCCPSKAAAARKAANGIEHAISFEE